MILNASEKYRDRFDSYFSYFSEQTIPTQLDLLLKSVGMAFEWWLTCYLSRLQKFLFEVTVGFVWFNDQSEAISDFCDKNFLE